VTFYTDVQATGFPTRQTGDISFSQLEHGHDLIGKIQKTPTSTGETRGLGLSYKQGAVQSIFKIL
jgi:hypothetical protein